MHFSNVKFNETFIFEQINTKCLFLSVFSFNIVHMAKDKNIINLHALNAFLINFFVTIH